LLVLDEPTNGLDSDGCAMLAALLREHVAAGRAALVATHDLAFADQIGASRLSL
jgi:energy-coupling factor transport system ATP-binding protein